MGRHWRKSEGRRGMALFLVLTVVAIATLMGFAMLSEAALEAQVQGNAARAAAADYVAESALQAGIFYMQYPAKLPPGWGSTPGHAIYAQQVAIGPAMEGDFDLDVTPTGAAEEYLVKATGRSGSAGGSRSLQARIKVMRAAIAFAAGFGGAISVPDHYTFNGLVQAGGTISGTVPASTAQAAAWDYVVPTSATINHYGAGLVPVAYTMPDGTSGVPEAVASPLSVAPVASGTNPGHVFYAVGDLTIDQGITIDGTLVVCEGSLIVENGGSTMQIRPVSGMPAVVVDNELRISWKDTVVQVDGVVWAGAGINWIEATNQSAQLTINGALLMPAGATLAANPYGSTVVNYVAENVNVPNLSAAMQPGATVQTVSWGPQ